MSAPLVSVLIPCFNAERHLEQTVSSVLSQTHTDLECLLVDDGSTDGTRQVCERFARLDSRVRYVPKEHSGISATRNLGIELARGEWIQQVDSDDFLREDKIRVQLERARAHGAEGDVVVYSDYEVVWEDAAGEVVERTVNVLGELSEDQLLERVMTWSFKPDCPLAMHNLLLRSSVFDHRMYDETMARSMDMELYVDLLLKDEISFIYAPIVGSVQRLHGSNVTSDRDNLVHGYIDFLEAVCRKDPELLAICPNVELLLDQAMRRREKRIFDRLVDLVARAGLSVRVGRRLKTSRPGMLRLAFLIDSPLRKARAALGRLGRALRGRDRTS